MNELCMVVTAYILICAFRGYHKGFFRIIYSMAATLIAAIFVMLATPLIAGWIQNTTPVYDQIEDYCEDYIRSKTTEQLQKSIDELLQVQELSLPEAFGQQLSEAGAFGIQQAGDALYQNLAKQLAAAIVWLIAFAISSIVILVVLFCIGRTADFFTEKKGIHMLNKMTGLFLGVIWAFLMIWLFFLLIRLTLILPASTFCMRQIQENAALKGLYDSNPFFEVFSFIHGTSS